MIKNSTLGGRSNRALLVLALLLGLLAAVLTAVYLSSTGGDSGGGTSGAATVPVVVASQDIAAGTRLEAGMVSVKSFPTSAVLSDAFEKTEDVVGQVVVVDILSGEQIVPARLVTASEVGQVLQAENLADAVPLDKPAATCAIDRCGQRGVSVAVAPVTASAGLIRPGDRVDVILAFQDGGAITILQDIEVLSIDQAIETVVSAPGTAEEGEERTVVSEGEENAEATTATLAVWPEEAQILTAGEEMTKGEKFELAPSTAEALGLPEGSSFECKGSVRLALRHVGQPGPVELETRGTCASLFLLIWG